MNYFIVNDIDRPYEEHVAYDTGEELRYLHPRFKDYNGMDRSQRTPMEDFGFDVEEVPGGLIFTRVRASTAQYRNGCPREWQGVDKFILPRPPAEDPGE